MSTINDIREFIEKEIRPTLQDDGGDIEFVDFEENIIKVKLYGACAHCPSSKLHMHGEVEELLKEKFPQIEGLELAEDSKSVDSSELTEDSKLTKNSASTEDLKHAENSKLVESSELGG